MDIFLKIVGSFSLIILAVIILVALYLYLQWRKLKKFADMDFTAMEIEVTPSSNPRWATFDKAKAYEKEILALGFKPVNIYSTSLGIELWVFTNSDHTQLAAISHTAEETFMEFTAIEAETMKAIDVTDNPSVAALTPKPYKISIGKPELKPKDLYQVFLKTISGKTLEKTLPENIPAVIEEQFKKEMTQMVDMGGIGEDDIDNLIELYGESLTDKQRDDLIKDTKLQTLQQRWEKCIDIFSESNDITPKIWQQYEGSMIVISDNDDITLSKEIISDTLYLYDEEDKYNALIKDIETSKDLINTLIEHLPQHKIKKIGSITEPLAADIYGYEEPENEPPYLK